MKKLLSFLGAFGLIANTTAYAVSCGTKDPMTNEQIEQLIKEYKEEVDTTSTSWINARRANLVKEAKETGSNSFFNIENVKKYGNNKDIENDKGEVMTTEVKNNFQADVFSFLSLNDLSNELQLIASKSDKYNAILLNNKVVDSIYTDNVVIEYTSKDVSGNVTEDYLLSSSKFDLIIKAAYKDQQGVKNTYEIKIPLFITFSNDGALSLKIKEIEKTFSSKFFNDDNKYSWIDRQALGISKEKGYEVLDTFYSDSSRQEAMKNLYQTSEFSSYVNSFIKTSYDLTDYDFTFIDDKPSLKVGTPNKLNIYGTGYLQSSNGYIHVYGQDKSTTIQNAIFAESTIEDTDKTFKNYGNQRVNKFIFDLTTGSDTWKSRVESFQTLSYKSFKKNENYQGKYDDTTSIMYGSLDVEGLQMKINSNFYLPFNALKISYSVAIDNSIKNSEIANNESSAVLGALYFNAIKGIKSFQNVYNVKKPTTDSTYVSFTGLTKDNTIEQSIWRTISGQTPVQDTGIWSTANMNSSLSLKNSDQLIYRNKLMNEGSQMSFNFGIASYFQGLWQLSQDYMQYSLTTDGIKAVKAGNGKGSDEAMYGFYINFNFIEMWINLSGNNANLNNKVSKIIVGNK
ncbi:lipoprotein [Spiroplasma floricola]|uniref:Lipoprotein n=1 Tax=Spiroplasma floricola 23-6 TaxID=1336749 RepID=A0A2K8SF03_9MOLU|nr:lipoprotein [Spiroplasma floricola]AUB31818.1 hypothetical protein SFLOR_v1c07700 [Spiroplasma floricola 23-6]